MLKNIVISILAAVIISDCSWWIIDNMSKHIAVIVGLAVVLFIFLLFLEETGEKLLRVRKIRQIVRRLQSLKLRN